MIRSATCHHLSGATWHFYCSHRRRSTSGQPPPDHRSTVVNDGSQRRSTPPDHRSMAAVNNGQRWRTTAGPPLDHRRTTGQRWLTASQGRSTVGPANISKPLKKVDSLGDYDSEDEVASVDSDMTNFLASGKVRYGTHNLLEQWTNFFVNSD
ncbi:hypothetical protein Tco_0023321 [Tanacetum coccineum]